MFAYPAVVCFSVYFFIVEINTLLNSYKDAAGIWHEDRFRPLVTAIANLTLNLIMVQFWGVYGILISTIISMVLVGMPWLLINLFTTIFERKMMKGYLKKLLIYTLTTFAVAVISTLICRILDFQGITAILVNAVICGTVTGVIFILLFRKSDEFRRSLDLLKRIFGSRINLSKFAKKRGGI